MSDTTKEEIRLSVNHVRCKKTEGELVLMTERIAWMPKNQDIFTISHRYEAIKLVKISNEGKAKIQLQLIMHDNNADTFHFAAAGQQQQIKDRDLVKDLLADLLPQFRQKISKDLEDKKRILLENPNLYQLYTDLVVSGIISAEDFWNHYAEIAKIKTETSQANQKLGVSQSFLSNLRPKNDGKNGTTCNLTFDDKQSIFRTYPSVRNKFSQLVPHQMTEVDFWTKFIQSHYFHANKPVRGDDLFADCKDKDSLKIDQSKPVDVYDQKDGNSYDGYGLTDFLATNKPTTVNTNRDLVKHFNTYSMRILNAMDESNLSTQPSEHPVNKIVNDVIMQEDDEIMDLTDGNNDSGRKLKGASLLLTDVDRYIYGSLKSSGENLFLANNIEPYNYKSQLNKVKSWELNIKKVTNSSSALEILKELSPGGSLMSGSGSQNFQDEIADAKKEEMKLLYSSLCELLRHFWACFPPTTPKLEAKFELMKNSLEGFRDARIIPFREKLQRENLSCDLASHLENLINVALTRYKKRKFKQNNHNSSV